MKAAIGAMSSKEMGSYKASRVFVIAATKCNPWIKLSWDNRKHYNAKN
jgi:hypothetical protein